MTIKIDNMQDTIDVRDIIERYENLESIKDNSGGTFNEAFTDSMAVERALLEDLLADLKGNGGEEQWRGDWYPLTLIRDSYFQTYAQELIEDCDGIPRDLPSYIKIDWQATARNIRVDYTSVEINGITYWYR